MQHNSPFATRIGTKNGRGQADGEWMLFTFSVKPVHAEWLDRLADMEIDGHTTPSEILRALFDRYLELSEVERTQLLDFLVDDSRRYEWGATAFGDGDDSAAESPPASPRASSLFSIRSGGQSLLRIYSK
jgi:hypothetical protein